MPGTSFPRAELAALAALRTLKVGELELRVQVTVLDLPRCGSRLRLKTKGYNCGRNRRRGPRIEHLAESIPGLEEGGAPLGWAGQV